MASPTAPASTKMPTPAAENLYDALSFKSSKPPPRNVIFFPPQAQAVEQLQMPLQALAVGIVQQQQPQNSGPTVGPSQQLDLQQQQAVQNQLPMTSFADPVRYVSWGPKTLYYVDNLAAVESSKDKGKKKKRGKKKSGTQKAKKGGKDEPVKFQKVILNGSEQLQTTEKTEVLGPDQGGGIKKTWICVTRIEVVSVEKEIEAKDVVLESEDESESSEESEDTSDEDTEHESEWAKELKVLKKKRLERKERKAMHQCKEENRKQKQESVKASEELVAKEAKIATEENKGKVEKVAE